VLQLGAWQEQETGAICCKLLAMCLLKGDGQAEWYYQWRLRLVGQMFESNWQRGGVFSVRHGLVAPRCKELGEDM
jgi:hypothetical protein